ncbi:hypothetical protein B0A75_19630 [Flavobacterium oncorhynchi]|uniref:Uncharacterized protein n=1 Tax=Flavobacterium oncorhynchi TaxID=728056 RepID=A0A226HKR3_9FLAO|nr:hypothetical protein [Flavobacterium oncorhynchi]OXA94694.1 hypothetical protein B0A75_19630 [Flavobacterium oncorhynchi]
MESKIILILGLLFFSFKFYAQKRENNSSKKNKNKLTGKEIVLELDKLNFFNLTEKKDLKLTKEDFEKSYDELSFFEGYMKDDLSFTDNRFYFIDSETLFEGGGLTEYLETIKPLFDKLNLKLSFSDENNNQTKEHWTHKIKLNGKEYTAFDNDFGDYDWGIAYLNFIEMLNDQLKLQNSNEQFYPISSGNDGRIVLLTKEQFDFITLNYPNNNERPTTIDNWKKELEFKK